MPANIIDAIENLVKYHKTTIRTYSNTNNRMNSLGESLEEYIKDLFAGTVDVVEEQEKIRRQGEVFSYLGNNSNPPDAMLRDGDAIEIKKIENVSTVLQLNSSHPKNKLFSSSPMISKACKEAEENWKEKDLMYVVGHVSKNNAIQDLFFVYGEDYAAQEQVYLDVKTRVQDAIAVSSLEVEKTKELARINKVDPLGITSLRVRGMWLLKNPFEVFGEFLVKEKDFKFRFTAIINNEKCKTLKNIDKLECLSNTCENFTICDKIIRLPDNPAQIRHVKVIQFWF